MKPKKPKSKKIVKPKKVVTKTKKVLVIKKKSKTRQIKTIKKKIKKPKRMKAVKRLVKRVWAKKFKKTRLRQSYGVAKKKTPRKINTQGLKDSFTAESFFKAKIKVIGIGGGGGSIVSEIGRSLHKATFVIADTDVRAFKKRQGIKYFLFGQELTHGLGTGVNPELARLAAESEKERISHFFDDQDIVIFVASLGGGLGSGATQVFAKAAENFNGITVGIFTLPFKFEGKNKYKIAYKALKELRTSLNVSITIPNEKIFKIIDANTAITDAFSMVNKNLIESLESLIDLIYSPGIINIDFADLRAILSGKGNMAFLNTAEAVGKDRAETIAQKILHNPLYQNNNFTAEKILFNIEGGGNLGMFEVDKISKAISLRNPKAKIIFGISKNGALKNKIKTTLLMTGGAIAKDPITEKVLPEVKEKIVNKKSVAAKPAKKRKRIIKKTKQQEHREKIPFPGTLVPFDGRVFGKTIEDSAVKKLNVMDISIRPKKAIRRNALEVRKAEELEENKKSLQEEEWEIPAFLRKVKFKP